MNDLSGFQRDLLWTVNGLERPHGLGIKSELEQYYQADIYHGRLYPNLDQLVEKGLLTKSKKDDRTNEYRVSERGRRVLQNRFAWEDGLTRGGS